MTEEELNFVNVWRDATLIAWQQKSPRVATQRAGGDGSMETPNAAQSVAQETDTWKEQIQNHYHSGASSIAPMP